VTYSDERFPLNETEVLNNRITPELVELSQGNHYTGTTRRR
jgi:hypothetical protein